MSTLAEIEAAVARLPRPQQETLLPISAVRLGGEVPASLSIDTEADNRVRRFRSDAQLQRHGLGRPARHLRRQDARLLRVDVP